MLEVPVDVLDRLLLAPWITVLTPQQQQRVERETKILRFAAGAVIGHEGELAREWLGILDGLAKVDTVTPDGRGTTFVGVASGGWVGEGALLKHERRPYEVVALVDSWVALVPQATFEWLYETSLPFNHFLVRQLNTRLGQFIHLVQSSRMDDVTTQVAVCVAALFDAALSPGASDVMRISQEEIARLCGVSRQVAGRALRELADAGLLKLHYGTIKVADARALSGFSRGRNGEKVNGLRHWHRVAAAAPPRSPR